MKNYFNGVHPMVIFWLGVLTGAILVGLVFFYKTLSPMDYQGALSKPGKASILRENVPQKNAITAPKQNHSIGDGGGNVVNPLSIGDGGGNRLRW